MKAIVICMEKFFADDFEVVNIALRNSKGVFGKKLVVLERSKNT